MLIDGIGGRAGSEGSEAVLPPPEGPGADEEPADGPDAAVVPEPEPASSTTVVF